MAVQNNTKQSLAQRWEDYQPSKSTLVLGVCCDGGRHDDRRLQLGRLGHRRHLARRMAATAGDVARGELASVICVENFKAAPDAAAKLVEFKAITDSYKKRQFVEAGGWATMPGQTSAGPARRRRLRRRARRLSFFGDSVTCAAEIFSRRTFSDQPSKEHDR